jgi:hypothetical protein
MSCSLINGQALGCKSAMGGIKTLYICNWENIVQSGVTTNATNQITGLTMASSTKFYEFQVRREQADFTEVTTTTLMGGVSSKQTLNLFLEKNQTTMRNQIQLLAAARLGVMFLDKNGQYWLMGLLNGCDAITTTSTSGKAAADANGYQIGIESEEPSQVYEVSSTLIADITSI